MDNGGLEDQNVCNEEEAEIDSVDETQVEVDHHNQQGTTPVLRQFLKFPMERVTEKTMTGSSEFLCLSRSSQLPTSSEYITLLVEAEQKKKEL